MRSGWFAGVVSPEGVKTVTELKGFKSGKVEIESREGTSVRGIQQNSLPKRPQCCRNLESSRRSHSDHVVTLQRSTPFNPVPFALSAPNPNFGFNLRPGSEGGCEEGAPMVHTGLP